MDLFMGFCSDLFEKKLEQTSPFLVAHFTKGGDFLEKIVYQEKIYFGKKIPPLTKLEELKDLQKNIKSLALCIVPDYHLASENILIFPL